MGGISTSLSPGWEGSQQLSEILLGLHAWSRQRGACKHLGEGLPEWLAREDF